jgi:hypothetical protein
MMYCVLESTEPWSVSVKFMKALCNKYKFLSVCLFWNISDFTKLNLILKLSLRIFVIVSMIL